MDLDATHILLVREPDHESGKKRVLDFFAKNLLVKYDSVNVIENRSFDAEHHLFWETIKEEIGNNQQEITRLIGDLQESGFEKITDLARMPRGYPSKTLHILVHLLDGFFGVDSSFYNLEEDSHLLSEKLIATIKEHPDEFRIITAKCSTKQNKDPNLLDKLRKSKPDL